MERGELIKKLANCQYNPIRDPKALEAFTDEGLEALDAHCGEQAETFTALQEELEDVKEELRTAQAATTESEKKLRSAESDLRAAKRKPATMTEEEWLASAPPSIKTLVEKHKKDEADRKDDLVEILKTAQDAYNEEELKTLELSALEKLAKIAKVDSPAIDFSAARSLTSRKTKEEQEKDVYLNPPDPYQKALEDRRKSDQKTH